MKCKGSKTIILVFFSIRLWLEFLLSLCRLLPYPSVCCIEILCIIPLFIYHLFWCGQQGCSVVGASHRRTGRVVGLPQGDIHKILIYHKQQIVSYRIEEAVSLNYLPLKIGPDIDLVCPTNNFFTNIVIEPSRMGAIWRPCSIRGGRGKLLFAKLCTCPIFWHSALTKLHR